MINFQSFQRLLQPSPTQNEKDTSYVLPSFTRTEAKEMLNQELVVGGVFGIEAYRSSTSETFTFFSPPQYKTNWTIGKRDSHFTSLSNDSKDITFVQLYTNKPSIFPIEMNNVKSFWEMASSIVPKHIDIMYQLLLAYRQDNWQERLQEQYDDYLNGIQQPSDMKIFRSLQRNINDKLDHFLKWEYKHSPIHELETKLNENGFRHNIRLALYGGNKHEHKKIIEQLKLKLNESAYTNGWSMNTNSSDDFIQNIKKRKLDNVGKQQVLTVSEILPFIMSEKVIYIEQASHLPIVAKRRKSSNPFKLLSMGDNLEEVDGELIAKRFIIALKELKNIKSEMVAKRIQSGSTLMKLSFDLPRALKFSELIKKNVIDDIQAQSGIKGLSIMQGTETGEFDVVLPLEKRQKVFLRNYIDTDEFKHFAKDNPLPYLVGIDEIGNPIYKCLTKAPHILLAGQTGSGKSKWLSQLLITLLLTRNPSELQFYMIDLKRVELSVYENFPHVQKICMEADESIDLLKQLINEMNRRYKLFQESKVKDISTYNNKFKDKQLARIVLVIDEFAELTIRCDDVSDYIQSLTQLARSSGIYIILGTQRPSVDVVSGIIKSNLPSKVVFKCANTRSYLTVLNSKPQFNLIGLGDGILDYDDSTSGEHVRFQGCLVTDGDESELISQIAESMDEDKVIMELPEVVEVEEESELDKLRTLILETGECRVGVLREHMKININRLSELMKELCSEGVIEKGESRQQGYRIVKKEESK